MTDTELFGGASVALMALSRTLYITSIFRGGTRPHAFSWLIWTAISAIGFAAQAAEGAGPGSWARGFSAATCCALAALGYFKGEKDITTGDRATLAVALSAIPLWIAAKTPLWSVLIVCVIDTIGYFPTVRKAWKKPGEELASSYFVSALCSLFSLFAIENYTLCTWLYPALLVFSNSALGVFLLLRRAAHAAPSPDSVPAGP
jgi:hypothetical protein